MLAGVQLQRGASASCSRPAPAGTARLWALLLSLLQWGLPGRAGSARVGFLSHGARAGGLGVACGSALLGSEAAAVGFLGLTPFALLSDKSGFSAGVEGLGSAFLRLLGPALLLQAFSAPSRFRLFFVGVCLSWVRLRIRGVWRVAGGGYRVSDFKSVRPCLYSSVGCFLPSLREARTSGA